MIERRFCLALFRLATVSPDDGRGSGEFADVRFEQRPSLGSDCVLPARVVTAEPRAEARRVRLIDYHAALRKARRQIVIHFVGIVALQFHVFLGIAFDDSLHISR